MEKAIKTSPFDSEEPDLFEDARLDRQAKVKKMYKMFEEKKSVTQADLLLLEQILTRQIC